MGKAHAQPHPARLISVVTALRVILSSVLGTGFMPIAPATFASFVALAAIWVLPRAVVSYGAVLMIVFFVGVALSSWGERRWGRDPRQVTIDEFIGMLVTFLLVPFSAGTAVAGFLLFRFFDIVKLPPIRVMERLPRGWGIVMDDVAAGFYANVILQIASRLIWRSGTGLWTWLP